MDIPAFHAWLTSFGEACERQDAEAAAALFAPGATYQPSPFGDPIRGRGRIAAHWDVLLAQQTAIGFQAEILGLGATYGIAHWRVSFRRLVDQTSWVVDGILLAAFDRRGRATSVRGWSHVSAEPPDLERDG